MDRESADRESADLALVEAARANAPSGPIVVSVCVTCKTADGGTVVGPDMFEAVKAAIGPSDHVQVRPVQCLSVCKRPATVAVTSAGRLHVPVRRPADRERHRGPGVVRQILSKIRLRPGAVARARRGAAQGHGGAGAADALVAGRRKRAEMTALATTLVLGGARSGKSAFAEQLIGRQRTCADLPRHRDRRR